MERAGKSRRGHGDRISSLPDCLIHLIMSFLTAQEAVQTCVLSKRWKNLWTTLPFLDFNLWKFKSGGESDDSESENARPPDKYDKFRDFVGMALLLRKPSDLHTFHLSCGDMCEWPEYNMFVRSWFFHALNHNPQVLKTDYPLEGSVPLAVFTCASLVDASFSYLTEVCNIKVINLPCLRRLHLYDGYLPRGFVEKLFSGCPMLEFFHMEECHRDLYSINSQSLKYLKAECSSNFWCEAKEKEIVLINTPNLLSFCYDICLDFVGTKILLKMPSLTSANIHFERSTHGRSYDGKSNILMGLSNVQNLKLSGYGIKEEMHGNQEEMKIAPFMGKRLEIVQVKFPRCDESFPQVMKHLQDITKKSRAQIITASQYNRDMDTEQD